MALSTLAPAAETAENLKPILLLSIWATCYAITIILFRVTGRWLRTELVFVEDVIILLSICLLVPRMVLVRYILDYGTNNVDLSFVTTEAEVHQREFGSQLVLITRLLYAAYLWVIKLSVGIYMIKLTDQFWAAKSLTSNTHRGRLFKKFLGRHLNHVFYITLGVSYVAIVLTELLECRPFSHNWQVIPDPGPLCRQAYGHVFTMGALNIVTDLFLVGIPMPMMMDAKLPWKLKAEVLLLVSFPLINIAFTLYRLPVIVSAASAGSQPVRTLLASIDILVSTATANILVVVSFLQDRGFKKAKYPHSIADGPIEDPIAMELGALDFASNGSKTNENPKSLRRHWDSDEDLMRDMYTATAPNTDIGESVTTTDTTETSCSMVETMGAMDGMRGSTKHLSPHQSTETHITTAQGGQVGDAEDVAVVALPEPSRRSSYAMHIVVETSWQVTTGTRKVYDIPR